MVWLPFDWGYILGSPFDLLMVYQDTRGDLSFRHNNVDEESDPTLRSKLFFLILLLVSSSYPRARADGENWLTGWDYRKSHTITGSSAGIQTDYQIGVKVYYGAGTDGTEIVNGVTFGKVYLDSKCRTDFGDINFTKSDGISSLDYWMDEKVDSTSALFWVEVDSIPASPSTVNIYVYYGKADATTLSHISNTFPFGDDFDGSAEPPETWSEAQVGTLTWLDLTANSAYKVYTFQDSSAEWHGNDIYKSVTPPATFALVSKHVVVNTGDKPQSQSTLFGRLSGGITSGIGFNDGWTEDIGYIACVISGTNKAVGGGTSGWATYIFEIRQNGTYIKNYWNGNMYQEKAETDSIDEVRMRIVSGATSSSTNPQSEIEYVFIRKYVEPEPIHTAWGSEEEEITIEPPSDPNLLFGAGFNASFPYVELHWNHSLVNVTIFEIQNSTDGVSWNYLGQSTTANYTDTQVINGTERYYRIRACNQTDGDWYNSSFTAINFEKVYFSARAPGVTVIESDAPWIALAIILSIIAFLLATRVKR